MIQMLRFNPWRLVGNLYVNCLIVATNYLRTFMLKISIFTQQIKGKKLYKWATFVIYPKFELLISTKVSSCVFVPVGNWFE